MVKNRKSTTSILLKDNLRSFFRSRLQFLAVILITTLAMTLFVGLASNSLSLQNRVNELYKGSNIADIWTTVTKEEERDARAIEKAVGEGGIVEKRLQISSKLNGFTSNALISDNIPTVSAPYMCDNEDNENFFIIDKAFAKDSKKNSEYPFMVDGVYQVVPVSFSISLYQEVFKTTLLSDMLPLIESDLTVMELLDMCVKEGGTNIFDNPFLELDFQVTGSMMFAENVEGALSSSSSFLLSRNLFINKISTLFNNNFAIPEIPPLSDENFIIKSALNLGLFSIIEDAFYSIFKMNNQYVAKVGPSTSIEQAKRDINEHFDQKEESNFLMCVDIDHLASNITIQNDIVQAEQLSFIFPMIFFLVAILVVLTTITQLIVKVRTQIGTLKALGVSRLRIIIHYMILSLIIVSIGAITGIILGPLILPNIMNIKYNILYSLPAMSFTISVPHAIIATLALFAATLLVTYLVIRKDVSLTPAMSMRPKVIKKLKEKKKETKVKKASQLSINMAFRNIKINITKSIMVILGVVGCTSLLACGFGIDDTLNYGIKNDLHIFYDSDMTVSYNGIKSLEDKMKNIEGIEAYEEYGNLPVSLSFGSTVYQTISYLLKDNSQFFELDNYVLKDKIALSQKVAETLSIKVGDNLSFNILGNNYNAEVGYIFDVFFVHGIYANAEVLQLNAVKHMKNNAWVKLASGSNPTEVQEAIKLVEGVNKCRTKTENYETIDGYVSSLSVMTLAVKIFAILLAVVVLYNFALMNYRERNRDIATMKVLGFSLKEISYSLIFETMFLTIIGIVFGLFLGFPMEKLVLGVNETPLVAFLYTIYPLSFVFSFVITFGTAFIVNLILTRKVIKIKMVESLKSIE